MIKIGENKCPECFGELRFFDNAKRVTRTKYRKTEWITVERFKCKQCGRIHRALPDNITPFKQYETELIRGVVEGLINSDTLGYEDYPCEKTMEIWYKQFK